MKARHHLELSNSSIAVNMRNIHTCASLRDTVKFVDELVNVRE